MTEKCLDNVTFLIEEISNVVQGLDPKKAHSQDKISIRMMKIYGNSIGKTLKIIYKKCLSLSLYPLKLKLGNIVPIHKKSDKQCQKNYLPVSLLPGCEKILERIIFDKMFQFFIKNKLMATNQSGFKPRGPCNKQLLSITHDIYKSFDQECEVRGVFLHISKVFDKVWHVGIIFKLK